MIPFDLVCHLGTLLAIFIVFRKQIKSLLTSNSKFLLQIMIGTLPLFPILLILKQIENLYDQTELLGYFFLITAALLWIGIRSGYEQATEKKQKHWIRTPLIIGIFQTFALLPGVSRSGATISAARLLGWKTEEALTFSFLLAIPAILGGTVLKTIQLLSGNSSLIGNLSISNYLAGFAAAFVFGLAALKILIKLAANQKMMYFVWYCLLIGLACILLN